VVRPSADGSLRVVAIADKSRGRFDPGETASAMTPIGRFILPGEIFAEFREVARALPPGAELDDVPVLQRLAARGALAGTVCEARFYDVGVPEGYHDAVARFPPTV
jgi:UTP-glucose-1-phosphate uridylyltransferase